MTYFRDFVVSLVSSDLLQGLFDDLYSSYFFTALVIVPFVLLLIRKLFKVFGGYNE